MLTNKGLSDEIVKLYSIIGEMQLEFKDYKHQSLIEENKKLFAIKKETQQSMIYLTKTLTDEVMYMN